MRTLLGRAPLGSYLLALWFVGFVIYGVADNFKYALIWPVAAYLDYQASRGQCVPIIRQNLH